VVGYAIGGFLNTHAASKKSVYAVLGTAVTLAALVLPVAPAYAQGLEPRSYSNLPVGLNFLIAGYGYADGKIAFDPSTPITDATYRSDAWVFAYARSLDAWGKSAKIDVLMSSASFSGGALVNGLPRLREMSGLGDLRLRFSMNFLGAPALSMKEFAGYRQDLIVGASLQVQAPTGQYDNSKLINIGENRWSFKPELGISKALGAWTLDLMPSVTLYADNTDFNSGHRLAQAPLYAMQGHVTYSFTPSMWISLNGTYFAGNRTAVDGVRGNNMQANSRAGLTLAFPVDRHNSVKLYASSGTWSRTGSEFNAIGIAWQYRWADGF